MLRKWQHIESSITFLLALHDTYEFGPEEIMTVVRKGNEYIHQANKGNPTIGQLARRLNEQCEIQLDKDDVELLRKFSIFEEGDPYD